MPGLMLHPDSLTKCLEVAGPQSETLEYVLTGVAEKVKKDRTPEYAPVMHELTRARDSARFQDERLSKLDIWSGAAGLPDKLHDFYSTTEFNSHQEFIAAAAVKYIPVEQITMDFIISDEAEFKRRYSTDGKALEEEPLEAMDIMFNKWLWDEHEMVMNDGKIYAGTEAGVAVQDKTPDAAKERAEKVRVAIGDEKHGFEHYLQKGKPDAQISIIQHHEEREEAAPSSSSSSH